MDDQIAEDVKAARLEELQSLIACQHERFQKRCVGRTFDVLFEKQGRIAGQVTGRSPYLQPVQVMAEPSLIGAIAPVTILRTDAKSLFGEITQPGARDGVRSLATAGD
jgi:tRNA-2-methylthio-N6-dimethylallyladenosine synthase